jgi:hypothetical protein
MPGLKENNISNGEVLAAVNKFITKNPEPIIPKFLQATPHGSYTHLLYSNVELDQKEIR